MRITGQVLVLDAADLHAGSAFWAALLGGTVAAREDWHSVIVDGAVSVGVQLAGQGGFRVHADPAGHPFCLCWGPPPLGEAAATHLAHAVAGQEPVADVVRLEVVDPAARGTGLGHRLVEEVERLPGLCGCATVRLDTRSDLVDARRLYARLGHDEVEAFNAGPCAEHWFAKDLPARARHEPF